MNVDADCGNSNNLKWPKATKKVNKQAHALISAQILSRHEPAGVSCTDSKWPDGITVVPWSCGKLLVWDASCICLLHLTCLGPPEKQEQLQLLRSNTKSPNLAQSHQFTPVVFETSGVMGPGTETFLKDLGSCLKRVSGDDKAYFHLLQRFSIAIQRGNCGSVLGSTGILTDRIPDFI